MPFDPNIPQPNDNLSDSQGDLLANNVFLNTSFGIDHYPFSDATSNNGFHNQVTTPLIGGAVHPTTAAAIPKFYGMQDTAPLGVIQYSRGPSDAVPSPVTHLQSPSAPIVIGINGTTNVLDFTGIPKAICVLYAADFTLVGLSSFTKIVCSVFWDGTSSVMGINNFISTANLSAQQTGNILQIKNNSGVGLTEVRWTLEMLRLE